MTSLCGYYLLGRLLSLPRRGGRLGNLGRVLSVLLLLNRGLLLLLDRRLLLLRRGELLLLDVVHWCLLLHRRLLHYLLLWLLLWRLLLFATLPRLLGRWLLPLLLVALLGRLLHWLLLLHRRLLLHLHRGLLLNRLLHLLLHRLLHLLLHWLLNRLLLLHLHLRLLLLGLLLAHLRHTAHLRHATPTHSRGTAYNWRASGSTGSRADVDLLGHVAECADVVAGFVLAGGSFDLDADFQRDAVELLAVFYLQHANSVGQCGQLLVGDVLSDGVIVLDIEADENLATRKLLRLQDVHTHGQSGTGAAGSWFDVGFVDHSHIPSRRNGITGAGIRDDVCSVEVQSSHGLLSLHDFVEDLGKKRVFHLG